MSLARTGDGVPVRYGIVALVVVLAVGAYAVLIGQSLLMLWTVLAIAVAGLSLFVVFLFYRLVVAVERIAYGP